MVIRASSGKQIDALIADLSTGSAVEREGAIARLAVLGPRAVERLIAVVNTASAGAPARIAALRSLEAVADTRALDSALHAVDDRDPTVASAGIATARTFLRGPRGAAAVDRLTQVALDAARIVAVRVTAIRALADLEPSTLKPVWKALRDDPDAVVQAEAESLAARRGSPWVDLVAELRAAVERDLPDDPSTLRHAIGRAGDKLSLPLLYRLIERVREREASDPPRSRIEWMAARATAHVALAKRGSRLALYDLRESLETATTPLPVEFLAALSLIGNASCLEAIAAAYAHSADDDWWRKHLADAFDAIVKRERVTRRHAVMKKVRKRWPKIVFGRQ